MQLSKYSPLPVAVYVSLSPLLLFSVSFIAHHCKFIRQERGLPLTPYGGKLDSGLVSSAHVSVSSSCDSENLHAKQTEMVVITTYSSMYKIYGFAVSVVVEGYRHLLQWRTYARAVRKNGIYSGAPRICSTVPHVHVGVVPGDGLKRKKANCSTHLCPGGQNTS